MTSICPGNGPSARKAWVPATFLVPAGAAANYIGNAGGVWASVIAAAIGVKTYDAVNACTSDPPGWPTPLTTDEVFDLTIWAIGTADWASGIAKLNQILDNVLWYALCECTGAATPAQPTFPAPPANVPTSGPTGSVPSSRLCVDVLTPVCGPSADPETSLGALDISPQVLPYIGAMSVINDIRGIPTVRYVSPSPSPTLIRTTIDGTGTAVQALNFWTQASGSLGTNGSLSLGTNQSGFGTHVDSGLVTVAAFGHWAVTVSQENSVSTPQPATICVEVFGASNAANTGCCPADPQLLGLLQSILNTVTPIQRYKAPFAFTPGATHSGLTGTGSIAIPRSVGVTVTVTAYPAGNFIADGNPVYIYDLGWVSVSETGGMIQEHRLSRQQFTWLPDQCQLADHFNYFLRPGVTISVQELYAEP